MSTRYICTNIYLRFTIVCKYIYTIDLITFSNGTKKYVTKYKMNL